MKQKYLIVMGTFRTGSTFLARALSTHKNITIPSDPYFYFFKALRNEIFQKEGYADFDGNSPVSDNFYSNFTEVNSKIRKYNLDIAIRHNALEEILENIAKLASRDSEKIVPLLAEVKAKNYKQLFERLIDIARQAYGNNDTIYCGFKVTFAEQFLQVLLNTYPDLKCVYVIRDPRAVAASQKAAYENPEAKKRFKSTGKYPILYVIRHWRKSLAYLADNIDKRKNVFPIRYEDIVTYAESCFQRICGFLDLDYDDSMCNAAKYTNGDGKSWIQNSSYDASRTISAKSVEKWREVLSEKETQLIEDLCSPEMGMLGYARVTQDNIADSVLNAGKEDISEIEPWIRNYAEPYALGSQVEAEKELFRRLLISVKVRESESKKRFFEKIYIGDKYLEKLPQLGSAVKTQADRVKTVNYV